MENDLNRPNFPIRSLLGLQLLHVKVAPQHGGSPESARNPTLNTSSILSLAASQTLGVSSAAEPVGPGVPAGAPPAEMREQTPSSMTGPIPSLHDSVGEQTVRNDSQHDTHICRPPEQAQTPPTPPPHLPSMWRYVDNYLMQTERLHNNPPYPMNCAVCGHQHDRSPIKSTFLPLPPCFHWVHYRCLIWRACVQIPDRNCCPECGVELFLWEGISMLTLSTRTKVDIQDRDLVQPYYDPNVRAIIYTERQQYEADCQYIEDTIKRAYARELKRVNRLTIPLDIATARPTTGPMEPTANMRYSAYTLPDLEPAAKAIISQNPAPSTDHSPNLAGLFHEIFSELHRSEYPKGNWLAHKTHVGLLLYGMLVLIKLKHHVEETTKWVINTTGWNELEESRKNLTDSILHEIRGNHMEPHTL